MCIENANVELFPELRGAASESRGEFEAEFPRTGSSVHKIRLAGFRMYRPVIRTRRSPASWHIRT